MERPISHDASSAFFIKNPTLKIHNSQLEPLRLRASASWAKTYLEG